MRIFWEKVFFWEGMERGEKVWKKEGIFGGGRGYGRERGKADREEKKKGKCAWFQDVRRGTSARSCPRPSVGGKRPTVIRFFINKKTW